MEVSSSVFNLLLSEAVILLSCFLIICCDAQLRNISDDESSPFPPNSLFGAASSAYQYVGAYLTDGKGLSNWDVFTRVPGYVDNGSNADVSIDFYHRFPEIIDLMVPIGLNSFQFSISWARILPKGRFGGVNLAGIRFYNKLIDVLLSKGIEPFVVLHHFDQPIELEKRYKSWLSPESVEDFKYFADICFKNFGDRIKHWVTFSEPNMMVMFEYQSALYPPARCSEPYGNCTEGDSEKEPLIAAHQIIRAHAAAVKIYKTKYQKEQGGQIGMVVETIWFEPLSNSTADKLAAERAQSFYSNWYMSQLYWSRLFDPIVFGRYPEEMTEILGSALPTFSSNDLEDLKLGVDFMGINHYTSMYVWDCMNNSCGSPTAKTGGYIAGSIYKDGVPMGEFTGMEGFVVYPTLEYVKKRLNNIPMYITENGYCEKSDASSTLEDSLNDADRINFLTDYLGSLVAAIRGGADVRGYFLWTLVDAFEWTSGYNKRFGIHHADFETLKFTPKSSATWYKQFIAKHKRAGPVFPRTSPQYVQEQ